jgi:hypothetical protein
MRLPASFFSVLGLAGCCVNPFVNTDTQSPTSPGSPELEATHSLEEDEPALQERSTDALEAGFDMRLVRVQPGVHLGTEQACDVSAAGRLEHIEEALESEEPSPYGEGASDRMSIQCASPTGESWADLTFTITNKSHAPEVQPGTRVRVQVRTADGGYFDYPVVDFVALAGRAPSHPEIRTSSTTTSAAFDLRLVQQNPGLVGSAVDCAISHVSDIDILHPADLRRRSYPAGAQNRMTVRCRHTSGEEWADLVFMPAQARSALYVRRGDVARVLIVSRNGGFSDYPVLQFASE